MESDVKSTEKSMESNQSKFNLQYQIKCFEHYRLMWMLSHGYNLTDLMASLDLVMSDDEDIISAQEAFEVWEKDYGFGGELWPCFGEFLANEYIQCGYSEGKGGIKP